MEEDLLINKYLAWMILFSKSKPLSLLTLQKTHDGEVSLSSYVPLINTTVCAIDNDVKTTFMSFFKEFEETVENYLKDNPDINNGFRKQLEKTSLEELSKDINKENVYMLSLLNYLERTLYEEADVGEA